MARHKPASTGTPATSTLTAAGIPYAAHAYEHDPRAESYGLEAAQALGVSPERVFKTLMAALSPSGGSAGRPELVIGVVPVSGQLDLKALARALGASKATMAEVSAAERATGYVAGGISPIGQKRAHRTVLDASALEHATILVSGGRRGLDIEITPANLVTVTSAEVAQISRS